MMKAQWILYRAPVREQRNWPGARRPAGPGGGNGRQSGGDVPTDEWLLSKFNFDLQGMVILE